MAYRRTYGSRDWSSWHTSQLSRQAQSLGGIDADVRKAFLALQSSDLLNFFFHYEKRYGLNARSYAEQAFVKWKSGSTRMSAQTTERLLQVLPPFLGTSVKYDLLQKLRERYIEPESHHLEIFISSYKDVITPVVERLVNKAYNSNLPEPIEARLRWLADDDVVAAKSLLAGAEAAAMRITLGHLDDEFSKIKGLLLAMPKGTVTHRIVLPYGVLTLLVKRGNNVSESNNSKDLTIRKGDDASAITSSDQLLRNAIRNLTPDQLSQISIKATEEAVKLQTEAHRADQRFHDASRDIDSFIEGTHKLKDQGVTFSNSGKFESASGSTSINTSKDNSKIWIIAVIALAILAILLILTRR